MSSSGSKTVISVLAPSIELFSAGSSVSGLGPYWTVKPLAVPVLSSPVAASVDAAVLVSVEAAELAEPPQAAREAAMQPAIATAAMFFIFMWNTLQIHYTLYPIPLGGAAPNGVNIYTLPP